MEDSIVTLFSDLTMSEIKCFARDLKKGAETTSTGAIVGSGTGGGAASSASSSTRSGNYDILDLIQIDPHSVGVIVKIENGLHQVLDQNGAVRTLESLNELVQKKRDTRRAVALDCRSNRIKVGDQVRVVDGEFKNRSGSILHIFRSFIFVKSNEILANCGVQVFRNSNIELVGAVKNGLMDIAGGPGIPGGRVPPMATGFESRSVFGGAGRGSRRDPLMGKSVNITTGPYKGYLGIVKDINELTARVELHTKSKTITVDRVNLMLQE